MPESEQSLGRQRSQFILQGKPETAQLFLPEGINREPLVRVKDLRSLRPPLDVLPGGRKRPYINFNIREMRRPNPENQAPVAKTPSIKLILVSFSGSTNIEESMRLTDRGIQRGKQYGKLIEFITDCEEKLQRGETPRYSQVYKGTRMESFSLEVTPENLHKLKRIAFSFYADELAKEHLTDELAKGIKAQMVLHEEAVVSEAEHILFNNKRDNSSPVNIEHTEISVQTNKPAGEKPNQKEQKEKPDETSKTAQDTPVEASKKEPEPELSEAAVLEAAEDLLKLDRPTRQAAEFFRELLNRPF